VVNAVSQESVSGALVRVDGGGEATSGPDGAFQVAVASPTATAAVSITSGLTVERVTRIRPTGPATITLIPKSINVAAFDQMFRPDGILRRWTEAPAIVVQRRVLEFTNLDATTFTATDTLLSDAEVDSIVDDLQRALSDLTGGAIDRFANQTVETAEEGQMVSVARTGVIVVAEYRGLTDATTFWGYTRWAWNERGELRAASMMLDRAFETSGSRHRQTLRTHELGHALGYSHVDARSSVMNVSARVALTGFDRDGARIAFQRPPLNMSPDIDPDPMTVNRSSTALTWKGAQ
jgi:hypothetical protein